jgi:hypothetical protein
MLACPSEVKLSALLSNIELDLKFLAGPKQVLWIKHERDCYSIGNEWGRMGREPRLAGQDCFRKSHSQLFMNSKEERVILVMNDILQFIHAES